MRITWFDRRRRGTRAHRGDAARWARGGDTGYGAGAGHRVVQHGAVSVAAWVALAVLER